MKLASPKIELGIPKEETSRWRTVVLRADDKEYLLRISKQFFA